MAVLVKPNGLLGRVYLAAIKPFRYLMVYPPMIREFGRQWRAGPPIEPVHRRGVGYLLKQASRRIREKERDR